ncbi:MAG: hypothetical protein LBR18_01095 [Tannerella sp.]|nr:hypothetical protein [Tannerella sp.]
MDFIIDNVSATGRSPVNGDVSPVIARASARSNLVNGTQSRHCEGVSLKQSRKRGHQSVIARNEAIQKK